MGLGKLTTVRSTRSVIGAAVTVVLSAVCGCLSLGTPLVELPEAERGLEERFNGVVLADRHGERLIEGAYGLAAATSSKSSSLSDRYRIGSVTKTFTSALVAVLQDEGLLRLDQTLAEYYPDFPSGREILLRDLVQHTGGLTELTQEDFERHLLSRALPDLEAFIAELATRRPKGQPGEGFEYNNVGYLILGRIVERVTGQTYFDALTQRLLEPLGLAETGYADFDADVDGLAPGHSDGMAPDTRAYNYRLIQSAGGLYSTAEDLRRWCAAFEEPGALPAWFVDADLGWRRGVRYGREARWHSGNTNSYAALLVRFPGEESCLVVLSNEARPGVPAEVRVVARSVYDPAR